MTRTRSEMGMGFDYSDGSLLDSNTFFKRKYRWMFFIENVCGEGDSGAPLLPPGKSGRPSLSFKEIDAQHITETVYFPGRPEWKPINITLYDIKKKKNPVIEWIKNIYSVSENSVNWRAAVSGSPGFKKEKCKIELYDGSGNVVEYWNLFNVWPVSIDFGDLDYGSTDIVTVDLSLRYDRAEYITNEGKCDSAQDENNSSFLRDARTGRTLS